jgi:hypothetical protein
VPDLLQSGSLTTGRPHCLIDRESPKTDVDGQAVPGWMVVVWVASFIADVMLIKWSRLFLVAICAGISRCTASDDVVSSQIDCIFDHLDGGLGNFASEQVLACTSSPRTSSHSHFSQAWEHTFAMVTDLDHASKDPHKFQWHAVMKTGVLRRNVTGSFSVEYVGRFDVFLPC